MITEAMILAGGLGTRLRTAVPGLPKCMAPVAGKPFINYVLEYLAQQGNTHFILALGYQSLIIRQHIQRHFNDWDISFSIEEEPLGTGGAIAKAATCVRGKYVVVTNGDTLYKATLQVALPLFNVPEAECLLFLKPMENIERYGVVEMDDKQKITLFREKQYYKHGLINGGLYVLDVPVFLQKRWPQKFSFEEDYLAAGITHGKFYGIQDDAYFIDIGIPADFEQANIDLRNS